MPTQRSLEQFGPEPAEGLTVNGGVGMAPDTRCVVSRWRITARLRRTVPPAVIRR